MIEKIGTAGYETVSAPAPEVLEMLRRILTVKRDPVVVEVGPGIGATTLEILRLLNGHGQLHLFGYFDDLSELEADLMTNGLLGNTELVLHPNGRTTYASYAWTLGQIAHDAWRNHSSTTFFDLVYLDGAHAFHHDAPAAVLIKEMIAPRGYLIFDDIHWSFSRSPSLNPVQNPSILNAYSQPMLDTPHVQRVVDLFIRTDGRYHQVLLDNNPDPYRAVFQYRPGFKERFFRRRVSGKPRQ